MANRLKSLRLEEISLVDEPANPGAVVLFAKRKAASHNSGGAAGLVSGIVKTATDSLVLPNPGEGNIHPMTVTKDDLTKALEQALGPIVKKLDAHDQALKIAKMGDKERAAYEKMSDDEKAAYDAMSDEEKAKYMAKMGGAEEPKKEEEDMAKSRVDVAKAVEAAVAKATAPLLKQIGDMKAREDRANLAKNFAKAVKASGLPEDDALDMLEKMDDANRSKLAKSWESLGAQVEALFTPVGKSGSANTSDAEAQLESLAKAKASKDNVSYAQAYDEVLKTAEGRALYAKI